MAKFTGSNMTLTIGGDALTCLQSVEVSESADIQEIECAGASAKEKIVGLTSYTLTVSGALETDDVTLLGYIDSGDSGAVVFNPAGSTTGNISITSTNGTVSDRTISTAVNGFGTYSATIQLDDLTIAAAS